MPVGFFNQCLSEIKRVFVLGLSSSHRCFRLSQVLASSHSFLGGWVSLHLCLSLGTAVFLSLSSSSLIVYLILINLNSPRWFGIFLVNPLLIKISFARDYQLSISYHIKQMLIIVIVMLTSLSDSTNNYKNFFAPSYGKYRIFSLEF